MREALTVALMVFVGVFADASTAIADEVEPPAAAAKADITEGRVALIGLDSLGMDAERVSRLETLFRVEIEGLSPERPPSAKRVRAILERPEHRDCGSETSCLVKIGKALGADVVVAGNVAALADTYVVNIKSVNVASGSEIGRVASKPLRGQPDELIENVRVAAYRLLAPSRLRGSISVVADIDGAKVLIDGAVLATTPMKAPIGDLQIGKRNVDVRADGYTGFSETVTVEFGKTSQVVVSLAESGKPAGLENLTPVASSDRKPFYKNGWFWAAVGITATAVVVGAVIGRNLSSPDVVDCTGGGVCD